MRPTPTLLVALVMSVVFITACGHTSAATPRLPTPVQAGPAPEYVPAMRVMPQADTASSARPQEAGGEDDSVSIFDQVDSSDLSRTFELILEKYVKADVATPALFYGMVRGMVASLDDPYSDFMDPEEAKLFKQRMDGNFAGIGAIIGVKDGRLTVMAVVDDSPAEKAGMKPGDIIGEVDGESTFDLSVDRAVMRIRGKVDTAVKLLIGREGEDEPLEISVTRANIPSPPPVTWKIVTEGKKSIMYLELSSFNEEAGPLFRKAVFEAVAKRVDGLVLDLRDDPGGLLNLADEVACYWLKPGQITVTMEFHGPIEIPQRCEDAAGILAGMPTAVLINGNSASASEIVTGALQDYGSARVIGEKSFGKGCGQSVFEYKDGSLLKLTTFYWKTPKGRLIHKLGITPDETVKQDKDKKGDEQLRRALEYLARGK